MTILGISAYYHDSAAALLEDGRIIAAAQEERFTRKKHDASFPRHAITYCLKEAGRRLDELDAIIFYDKPLLKFERLLETYYSYAPRGLRSFIAAMPVWVKEKLFMRNILLDALAEIEVCDKKKLKLLFSEHHLSHAASAFYPSPFNEAAILTIDGVGEWATASVCHGKGSSISILKELHFPHSVGLLYSAFTYYCGFKVNSGEYKLMGLAPYGDADSERTKRYEDIIRSSLVTIHSDGSITLTMSFFNYSVGSTMVHEKKWEQLFGLPRRKSEGDLTQDYCDLALAIQHVTEDIVCRMAKTAHELTGSRNLCLAGGVALNCVANSKIVDMKLFDSVFIQPAAGDAGGALGAALAAHHLYFQKPRPFYATDDSLSGSYLGPEFTEREIALVARSYRAACKTLERSEEICQQVADLLDNGHVVGWFQGRMEWGPRALGNRSILADARNPEMQKKLNLQIKYREGFRPFAPIVRIEDAGDYFEWGKPSPYMLFVADVCKQRRKDLPKNFSLLPLKQKLYYIRSDIPAVTHLDFSARLQTVHRETNPLLWALLAAFKEKTGCGVLVNTSFNIRGEPIVCTPEDAYRCFMRTEMDALVMGTSIFLKNEQRELVETKRWQDEFVLD